MNSNRSLTLVRFLLLALLTACFAVMAMPAQIIAQDQEQQKAEHPQRYTVTDLGTLGGNFSFAFGINNKGMIQGFSTLSGNTALHRMFTPRPESDCSGKLLHFNGVCGVRAASSA